MSNTNIFLVLNPEKGQFFENSKTFLCIETSIFEGCGLCDTMYMGEPSLFPALDLFKCRHISKVMSLTDAVLENDGSYFRQPL